MKHIPIIAVSQQNRSEFSNNPSTANIAQSDRISQDSTILIFIVKKDDLLKQNGWKVLRLSWKWIIEQHFIHIKELYSIVYDFIK